MSFRRLTFADDSDDNDHNHNLQQDTEACRRSKGPLSKAGFFL
jgi:hypothetical protein